LLILYGSETGNAQELAERLQREARGLKDVFDSVNVMPMDAYPVQRLPLERNVVFIASNIGQGEPPRNMKRFWRFLLRKDLEHGSLSKVNAAVFGLGDTSYKKYNWMARLLYSRLLQLGANMLVDLNKGLGNEQDLGGVEARFSPWLLETLETFAGVHPSANASRCAELIRSQSSSLPPSRFERKFSITLSKNADPDNNNNSNNDDLFTLRSALDARSLVARILNDAGVVYMEQEDGEKRGASSSDHGEATRSDYSPLCNVTAVGSADDEEARKSGFLGWTSGSVGTVSENRKLAEGYRPAKPSTGEISVANASHNHTEQLYETNEVRHVSIALGPGSRRGSTFAPGDVISILPLQNMSDVRRVCKIAFDCAPEDVISFARLDGGGKCEERQSQKNEKSHFGRQHDINHRGDSNCLSVRVGDLIRGVYDINSASPNRSCIETSRTKAHTMFNQATSST